MIRHIPAINRITMINFIPNDHNQSYYYRNIGQRLKYNVFILLSLFHIFIRNILLNINFLVR